MGNSSSSQANAPVANTVGKTLSEGQGGRKSYATEATARTSTTSFFSGEFNFEPSQHFEVTQAAITEDDETADDSSVFEDSDYESDDEQAEQEYQEALAERRRVLEDARNLKKLAGFFNHPEKPVEVDAFATARCFFDRHSAPERLSAEEAEEKAAIMADLQALKSKAVDFLHPERPVVTTDPFSKARCFFDRPSAPPQEDPEDAAERAQILADAKALKAKAIDFMHPERPVVTTDPFACGRNYFSTLSFPEQEDPEEAAERVQILADAKALKASAVMYSHPELPVVCTDPFACGRNYYSRASAVPQEDAAEAAERAQVLAEAQQLKKLAVDYHHPELPVVTTDPYACGRNYFSAYSAPQVYPEEEDERACILADAKALKQKAVDFMHPELPVVTTDPYACGRNWFSRPSAPEQEDHDIDEERELILADAKALKQKAVDYKHPELPVISTDPFACGRNFFNRYSAPEQEDPEEAEEKARVLADCQALKEKAIHYKHPERPVITTDPAACARCFFDRYSAPEQMDPAEAEERARVLADCAALKQKAVDFMHPELPVVTTDSNAQGRNFFSRYSAAGHAHCVHVFPAHEHDEHHEEHHEHVEHWGMDEEHLFDDMRQNMVVPMQHKVAAGDEEEEGNLSRSPSSVMLYAGESIYD